MADIFGVEKTVPTKGVLSFLHVTLSIGNEIKLCQLANLNYQRTITPVMAVGIPTIFLSPLPGQGTLLVSRAIGEELKFGEDLKLDNSGCSMLTFTLSTGNTGKCNAGGGGLTGKGMMSGYTFNVNVGGGVSVTDGCTLAVVDVGPTTESSATL